MRLAVYLQTFFLNRFGVLTFSFCLLFLLWSTYANAQRKKQPIDTISPQWTLRVDVLTSETYNGFTFMPGVDYRQGRHKFHAGLLLGPFSRGVITNVFGPYFAYRYFVPEKISFLHPYGSASFSAGRYTYKGAAGEKSHNVASVMAGIGCELVLDQHFFLDANIGLGARYMKQITTIDPYDASSHFPQTYTSVNNVIMAPEIRIGAGYTF